MPSDVVVLAGAAPSSSVPGSEPLSEEPVLLTKCYVFSGTADPASNVMFGPAVGRSSGREPVVRPVSVGTIRTLLLGTAVKASGDSNCSGNWEMLVASLTSASEDTVTVVHSFSTGASSAGGGASVGISGVAPVTVAAAGTTSSVYCVEVTVEWATNYEDDE